MSEPHRSSPSPAVAIDFDPHDPAVLADQRRACDSLRDRCPVARIGPSHWLVLGHADVRRVIEDHETFSNVVSTAHPAVPHGMDPPEHTAYRAALAPCFDDDLVAGPEPAFRRAAGRLVDIACRVGTVELTHVALRYAALAQCIYLGWPDDLAHRLIDWTRRNQRATAAADRPALEAIGRELASLVADITRERLAAGNERDDVTARLLRARIDGRPIERAALTSILRNVTMGEVGTIAASVGILVHDIAADDGLQVHVRRQLQLLPAFIDELLRRNGPLVSNRRRATRDVTLGGRPIRRGDRVTVNWIAANRDPAVFPDPDRVRLDRNPADNLLFGSGIHACPGAALSRLELRVFLEELLAATHEIRLVDDAPPVNARPPAAGFASLAVRLVT